MRPKEDYLGANPLKRVLVAVAWFFIGLWQGLIGSVKALPGKLKRILPKATEPARGLLGFFFYFWHFGQ